MFSDPQHQLKNSDASLPFFCGVIFFCKGKGKDKVHPQTGHEDQKGEQRYSSKLSLTSALDGGGQLSHPPAALPPRKDPEPTV
jgi:hypothetical protein